MDAARCPHVPVSLETEVLGWQDFDGNRYEGIPDDLTEVHGLLVHASNPASGDDGYYWAYTLYSIDDWDWWYDYIEFLGDMYGMSLE